MNKLKTIVIIFAGLIVLSSCGNTDDQNLTSNEYGIEATADNVNKQKKQAEISFVKDMHDFGKLKSGEIVSYVYKFENTGKANLIITQVKPDCGCTTPSFPRYAIAPGEKGEIKVKFNTQGRSGLQVKGIKVIANTNPQVKVLKFKAIVEK